MVLHGRAGADVNKLLVWTRVRNGHYLIDSM